MRPKPLSFSFFKLELDKFHSKDFSPKPKFIETEVLLRPSTTSTTASTALTTTMDQQQQQHDMITRTEQQLPKEKVQPQANLTNRAEQQGQVLTKKIRTEIL